MSIQQITAFDILSRAAAAHNPEKTDEVIAIMFLDQDRNTQAVLLYAGPDEEGDEIEQDEEVEMCFEDINESLDAGWRPVCIVVGKTDEQGDIDEIESMIPLYEEPSLDDQAVMWALTDE